MTQTNWNGLVGSMEIRAVDPVAIDDLQVYPDLERKRAKVCAAVERAWQAGDGPSGTLGAGTEWAHRRGERPCRGAARRSAEVVRELNLGPDVKLWDEFSPRLHVLNGAVSATSDGKTYRDERAVRFGMRAFAAEGTRFTLNGRPIFLRGTLECAIFPRTGYPPTSVGVWRRIYRTIRSYGLNFMRFHSWCPPEAAFDAADLEGVRTNGCPMQPAGPVLLQFPGPAPGYFRLQSRRSSPGGAVQSSWKRDPERSDAESAAMPPFLSSNGNLPASPMISRLTRSLSEGLWPTIIRRSVCRSRSQSRMVWQSESVLKTDEVSSRSIRPSSWERSARCGGAGQRARDDAVKLQTECRQSASDLLDPLFSLGSQRPLVLGNSRRSVGDGNAVAQNVKLMHVEPSLCPDQPYRSLGAFDLTQTPDRERLNRACYIPGRRDTPKRHDQRPDLNRWLYSAILSV